MAEKYLASGLLKQFQSLTDQIAQIASLSLVVLNLIADVGIVVPENVEDGQNLTVVGHQSLANHVS